MVTESHFTKIQGARIKSIKEMLERSKQSSWMMKLPKTRIHCGERERN